MPIAILLCIASIMCAISQSLSYLLLEFCLGTFWIDDELRWLWALNCHTDDMLHGRHQVTLCIRLLSDAGTTMWRERLSTFPCVNYSCTVHHDEHLSGSFATWVTVFVMLVFMFVLFGNNEIPSRFRRNQNTHSMTLENLTRFTKSAMTKFVMINMTFYVSVVTSVLSGICCFNIPI